MTRPDAGAITSLVATATERFVRASGPGGQNVNKVATAVELRFDLAAAPLAADVKARLRALAGSRVTTDDELLIDAREHRTQSQNREAARARLVGSHPPRHDARPEAPAVAPDQGRERTPPDHQARAKPYQIGAPVVSRRGVDARVGSDAPGQSPGASYVPLFFGDKRKSGEARCAPPLEGDRRLCAGRESVS